MSHIIFYGFGFYTGISLALAVNFFPIIIPLVAKLKRRYHWYAFALSVWVFIRLCIGHISLMREIRSAYVGSHEVIPFFSSISITSGVLFGLVVIGLYYKHCLGHKN